MSLDPNLERWIKSSLNIHFDNGKGSYKLFIEGSEIDLATIPASVELRINGPRYKEISKDNHFVTLEVNLACSVKFGTDAYELDRMLGKFRALCDQAIPINKYGDDNEFVGCLSLRTDESHPIDIINWGQVNMSPGPVRVLHATIDAYYKMEI